MYRVMLADDEPIMRKALLTLTDWQALDCEIVFVASNGQEVMDNLQKTKPDILITDIKMPGRDGIELARYIRERRLSVKVIILTAYADFSYAQSALKYGVVDYVTKTGVFDGLIAAVNRAKEAISEEKAAERPKHQQIAVENFFKSVFDGSLYEEEEIKEELAILELKLQEYVVILLKFQVEEGKRSVKEVHKSLNNFFAMAFSATMLQAIPVERDTFAIILTNSGEGLMSTITSQSETIIDTMDNFMKLSPYIGISKEHTKTAELRCACREAEEALRHGSERKQRVCFSEKCCELTAAPVVNTKEMLVEECRQYIEDHFEENIIVTDIARGLGASASYLSRIFKEITGQTIIHTLNQKKVACAKVYLCNTDFKIYEIAEKLGFENATYFSHFFKKYTGVSPKDYKGKEAK